MGLGIAACIPILLVLAGPPASAQDRPEAARTPPARVQVIKVWATSAQAKEEKPRAPEGEKDPLKDYRKLLEEKTGKKYFAIEGKVDIQDAVPGKALAFPLLDDYKLEITPTLEGKGEEEKLVMLLSLRQGKVEKRGPYKFCGTLPLIYMLPIHQEGRSLVVITQKLPPKKEPAAAPKK